MADTYLSGTVTIAGSASVSSAFDCNVDITGVYNETQHALHYAPFTFDIAHYVPTGIIMPGTIAGSVLSFQVSVDGASYLPLYNADGVVSYSYGTARAISVDPVDFAGFRYVKLVTDTAQAAAPVNVVLALRPV